MQHVVRCYWRRPGPAQALSSQKQIQFLLTCCRLRARPAASLLPALSWSAETLDSASMLPAKRESCSTSERHCDVFMSAPAASKRYKILPCRMFAGKPTSLSKPSWRETSARTIDSFPSSRLLYISAGCPIIQDPGSRLPRKTPSGKRQQQRVTSRICTRCRAKTLEKDARGTQCRLAEACEHKCL